MPIEIDYALLQKLENAAGRMSANVPNPGGSQSGVTICTGFDLGARNENDLLSLGIRGELLDLLSPYLGIKKWDAVNKLKARPLVMTTSQCVQIDTAVKTHFVSQLRVKYNAHVAKGKPKFEDLPGAVQTVMLSVAFQYGLSGLSSETPLFWRACLNQDWARVISLLKNFDDIYTPRRLAEAKYLEEKL